mmetsp:Transcript_83125/g.238817  ORF Transcript_83125/g.238817 Transcript_83125/m.238817 type:complete len:509 (-) Transcript_83125:308-1834(-)
MVMVSERLFALAVSWLAVQARAAENEGLKFSPSNEEDTRIVETFGKDFLWSSATAAYQVEGAWNEGGRQKSIWDVFSQTSGRTYDNETGDVADDFYHRYADDIQTLRSHGFNAFRYSISWSRIFPLGAGGQRAANPVGVEFYKNVTRNLLENGITPILTLFHWDLPEDLDWLDPKVVTEYLKYVDFVFETFPEVKHWTTFNEPWTFCSQGYESGTSAPGRVSSYEKFSCGHHVLLAHAQAVELYREKYLAKNQGTIGIVLNYDWTFPLNASDPLDLKAVQCSTDFALGWWADPVHFGDYPACMKERLGDHLPKFTEQEKALLKGSVIGPYLMNTYGARYTTWDPSQLEGHRPSFTDLSGNLIGPQADSPWLHVVPVGIRKHLEYVNQRYKPDGIIVTENGCDVPNEDSMPLGQALKDSFRVNFFRSYLAEAAKAVRESGVPLKGYIAWSLLDNFEWSDGYAKRFGLTYVNYTTQQRYPKASANWFRDMIAAGRFPPAHGAEHPSTVWV